jgi:hypothetical protein
MDFLLFPGGILGAVVVLFLYLKKQEKGKYRSITGRVETIVKSNLTPASDIAQGYAAVAASMRQLRAAKQEEHSLLLGNWKRDYMALLPDTDPEKSTYLAQIQGIKIETASFTLDRNGIRSDQLQMPLVEDGPDWIPLKHRRREPEEMTYTQRRIQSAGAFVRTQPHTKAEVIMVLPGNNVFQFEGYVVGERVNGNPNWLVYHGKESRFPTYVHTVATTDKSVSGLPNLTDPGNLDPDQQSELERIPAIVRNYQGDQVLKYQAEPATKIPSTLRKSYH